MTFEGRTALVTGGTRGIGLAIVRALRREGARVIAIGKSSEQIAAFKVYGASPYRVEVRGRDGTSLGARKQSSRTKLAAGSAPRPA